MNTTDKTNELLSAENEAESGIILNYRKPSSGTGTRIRSDSIRERASERMKEHKKKSGFRIALKILGRCVIVLLTVILVAVG